MRVEKDTMGEIKVPQNRYWGAQTQRSLQNFSIGNDLIPKEVIYAYATLKKAAALTNADLDCLSKEKSELIVRVCDEILEGKLDDEFPLSVWQTGSGTHTNMNINEVISNRAHVLLGNKLGEGECFLRPNDDVNKSQSSNDTFPTAMHIAAVKILLEHTIPAIEELRKSLHDKVLEFSDIIKIGRTHMMDATPITFGQEFSAYVTQLDYGLNALKHSLTRLYELPLGGTAVGTGINAPDGYSELVCKKISKLTQISFSSATNKFESIAANDGIVESHNALKLVATGLMKIGNDIRLLSSGPRSGLAEIILPANEPGSSIMPGKVNPTQCEALTMVCAQVLGNDVAITVGGMQGNLELNAFKPLIIHNYIHSARILADSCQSFAKNCVQGMQVNQQRIKELLDNSLMLVTALNPHIGYYKAAEIAKAAFKNKTTLKEEAIKSGYVTEEEFDKWVDPKKMI